MSTIYESPGADLPIHRKIRIPGSSRQPSQRYPGEQGDQELLWIVDDWSRLPIKEKRGSPVQALPAGEIRPGMLPIPGLFASPSPDSRHREDLPARFETTDPLRDAYRAGDGHTIDGALFSMRRQDGERTWLRAVISIPW